MMKMIKIYLTLIALAAVTVAYGETSVSLDSLTVVPKERHGLRMNRIDREINKGAFVLKGEVMAGATASYGTLTSEDCDLALILEHINFKGSVVTVKPFIGYVYHDNHAIGVRFGYTRAFIGLDNADLNLGEANDIDISVGNMKFKSSSYSFGAFHRSYVPIDAKGRFGVFGELELSGVVGRSDFRYMADDEWRIGKTNTYRCNFSFNPGMAVYVFPNVCATVSFGLGGLQYTHIRQFDGDGNFTGKRNFSKMRFRLNIADIHIGVTLHLWSKKSEAAAKRAAGNMR